MDIYFTDISNITEKDINKEILSNRCKDKFDRLIKNDSIKAVQTGISDHIIRYIAKNRNVPFKLKESEKGKPYIENCNFDFSVSHSNTIVAVGVSNKKLGIDIEMLKPLKSGIEKKVLNELEIAEFFRIEDQGERERYFYKCFTEKESYVKFLGCGFNTLPCEIKNYSGGKFVTKYLFLKGNFYCLTVCSSCINSIHAVTLGIDEINK